MFLGLMMQNILWFAPAPFLSLIVDDLGMNMMQAGLSMSVIGLITAISGMFLGEFFRRIGIKHTFSIALVLMALGSFMNLVVNGFWLLLSARILIGIGFGFCLPVAGTVIMTYFSKGERPYLNTINSLLPYFATAMTFILTIPLFQILGSSWRITLAIPGVFSLGALILWQKYYQEKARPYVQGEEKLDRNILKEIIGNKQVRLLTIADTCDMWSFQFVTTYLATFFYTEAMIPLGKSSYLMSIFPIAGIIAGITCGIAMGRIGLRKPFTWPLHIMIFVGTTIALYMTGTGRMIGIFLSGFGNAGWAPALFTMPMEFENMTPEKVGAVYTLMLSAGFFAAFLSPFLGGYLTEFMSLRTVIFLFSMPSLLAAWATWKMKETGSANRTKGNRIMN
jgi:MFS family permease